MFFHVAPKSFSEHSFAHFWAVNERVLSHVELSYWACNLFIFCFLSARTLVDNFAQKISALFQSHCHFPGCVVAQDFSHNQCNRALKTASK